MANEQNLKVLSPSDARKYGRMGGIISGQVRRDKKRLKDIVMTMASVPVVSDEFFDYKYVKKYNVENPTFMDAIIAQLIDKAKRGDLKAMKLFFELIREKPQIPTFNGSMTEQEVKVSYRAKKQTID